MGSASFGTLLKIGSGGTPETFSVLAEVVDISGPGLSLDTADATYHESGGVEAVGLLNGSEISFEINYIPTETTHGALSGLLHALETRARWNFKIVFPDDNATTWSFSAIVTSFEPDEPVGDRISATVDMIISGRPVLGTVFAFAATKSKGVFYCPLFTVDPTQDPVWSAINGGLPALDALSFAVDYDEPGETQYVLLSASRNLYRRRTETSDDWELALSDADADALVTAAGETRAGTLAYVAADRAQAGRVYAIWTGGLYTGGTWLLESSNYGGAWSVLANVITSYSPIYSVSNLVTVGDVMAFGACTGATSAWKVYRSADRFTSWKVPPAIGSSTGSPWVSIPHVTPGVGPIYALIFTGQYDLYAAEDTGGATLAMTLLQDALNIGPTHPDAVWQSDVDRDHQRVLVPTGKLYSTVDAWANVVNPAPVAITPIPHMMADYHGSVILYGRTGGMTVSSPETVLAGDDEDDVAPFGRSGVDPENAATTVSIPYNCGGLAYGGLFVNDI